MQNMNDGIHKAMQFSGQTLCTSKDLLLLLNHIIVLAIRVADPDQGVFVGSSFEIMSVQDSVLKIWLDPVFKFGWIRIRF